MFSGDDLKKAFKFEDGDLLRNPKEDDVVVAEFKTCKMEEKLKKRKEDLISLEFPTTVALKLTNSMSRTQLKASLRAHFSHRPTVDSAAGEPWAVKCMGVRILELEGKKRTASIQLLGVAKKPREMKEDEPEISEKERKQQKKAAKKAVKAWRVMEKKAAKMAKKKERRTKSAQPKAA